MTEETRIRIENLRIEDLRRLAGQAERKGVRILVDRSTGTHVATSASDPTRCYVVSREGGCTCLGAIHGGLCGHLGLLLSELGLLGDDDEDGGWDEVVRERVTTSRWIGGARDGYRVERTVAA